MTDEQVLTIAAADNATLTFINLMVSFLEMKAVATRAEFNGFVDDSIATWRAERMDPLLLKLIEIKAKGFVTDRPPPAVN